MVETKNTPLVSIALCTYNGEKYLVEQLQSLVHQTYPNVEIIAVDDCSSDGTVDILKDYEKKYPFFKVHTNPHNLGWDKNFERCISLCNGEFIAISDQDDIWEVNKLERQVSQIGDNLLIYCNSKAFCEGKPIKRKKHAFHPHKGYDGNDPRVFLYFNVASGHNLLFRKEFTQKLDPIPQGCYYDWWYAITATHLGKITCCDEVLVKHRIHRESATAVVKVPRSGMLSSLTKAILRFPELKHRDFYEKLLKAQIKRETKGRNFPLFWFTLTHMKVLYTTDSKSLFSKLNHMRKILHY